MSGHRLEMVEAVHRLHRHGQADAALRSCPRARGGCSTCRAWCRRCRSRGSARGAGRPRRPPGRRRRRSSEPAVRRQCHPHHPPPRTRSADLSLKLRHTTRRWDSERGIDLGGTKIQAVIVGARNGVRGQSRMPTPKDGGPEGVIKAMAEAVAAAAEQAKVKTADLDGVGVGSPGDVENAAGTVANAYNVVPDWNHTVKVAEQLRKLIGARVALGNDVRVATTGRVRAGRGQAVLVAPGRLLGHRRRRRHHPERRAVARPRRRRRDRAHGRAPKRRALHLRAPGCMEAYAGRKAMEIEARHRHQERRQDVALQDHEEEGPAGDDERSVGRGARARRRARRSS